MSRDAVKPPGCPYCGSVLFDGAAVEIVKDAEYYNRCVDCQKWSISKSTDGVSEQLTVAEPTRTDGPT